MGQHLSWHSSFILTAVEDRLKFPLTLFSIETLLLPSTSISIHLAICALPILRRSCVQINEIDVVCMCG